MWWLFLHSPQSERHAKRSTGCVCIAIRFSDSLLIFMCVFAAASVYQPQRAWLHARFYVSVWASTNVLRVRSEDVTQWSFITRDTLSPALLYTEAMFYKRITRQRAPGGHPLPPRATCKDVHRTSTAFITHLYLFATSRTGQGFFARGDFEPIGGIFCIFTTQQHNL